MRAGFARGKQVVSSLSVICWRWTWKNKNRWEKRRNNDGSALLDATLTFRCSSGHHRLSGTSLQSDKETKEQMLRLFIVNKQPGSTWRHVALQTYHHLITVSYTATQLMTSPNDTDVPPHPIPLVEIKKERWWALHIALLCISGDVSCVPQGRGAWREAKLISTLLFRRRVTIRFVIKPRAGKKWLGKAEGSLIMFCFLSKCRGWVADLGSPVAINGAHLNPVIRRLQAWRSALATIHVCEGPVSSLFTHHDDKVARRF